MRKVFEIVGATATAVALFVIVSSFFEAIKERCRYHNTSSRTQIQI